MVIIKVILALFMFVSFLFLVIGLIKPQRVLRWSEKPTRWKVVGWWFLAVFVISWSIEIVNSMKTSEEIINEAGINIGAGKYDVAIEQLKSIKPEDSLYLQAQDLIGTASTLISIAIIKQSAEDIENGKYDVAIMQLKKIASEDIFAKQLLDKAENLLNIKNLNMSKLVVKDIPLYSQNNFKPVFVDEQNNEVVLPDDINSWFEGISSASLTMPKGTSITALTPNHLSIAGKIIFEFFLDGKEYSMELGIGSVVVVSRTNRGTYKLFPEETAKFLTE